MKIYCISDLHNHHRYVNIDKEADAIIIAGDVTNPKTLYENEIEFNEFKNWLFNLDFKHKILIAGNHDAWATKNYNIDDLKYNGIIYLEHEYFQLEHLLLFGSPYTPNYKNWYFMKDRNKLQRYWDCLDEKPDILITHGPPKGILDLSHSPEGDLEYCGDKSLFNTVFKLKPSYHIFGHIHNSKGCINQGIRVIDDITFMNVSCVTNGKWGQVSSHGITIEI